MPGPICRLITLAPLSISHRDSLTARSLSHSAIIGARLRYLITGEPAHLAAEVR